MKLMKIWNIYRKNQVSKIYSISGHHLISAKIDIVNILVCCWTDTIYVGNIYIIKSWWKHPGVGEGGRGVGKRAIIRRDKEQEIDWNIVMDWLAELGVLISRPPHCPDGRTEGSLLFSVIVGGEWGMMNCPLTSPNISCLSFCFLENKQCRVFWWRERRICRITSLLIYIIFTLTLS